MEALSETFTSPQNNSGIVLGSNLTNFGSINANAQTTPNPNISLPLELPQSLLTPVAVDRQALMFGNMCAPHPATIFMNEGAADTPTEVNKTIPEAIELVPQLSDGSMSQESCRICRCHRSDIPVHPCPCLCKGSVGFVHFPCLRRWMQHLRDNRCEICKSPFIIPRNRASFFDMMHSFVRSGCLFAICKQLIFGLSLLPLGYIALQKVVTYVDFINEKPAEDLTGFDVFSSALAIFASGGIFFHFIEYCMHRVYIIHNIIQQWWYFGGDSDFAIVDMEDDIGVIFP